MPKDRFWPLTCYKIFFPSIVVVTGKKLGKEPLEGKCLEMAKNVTPKNIKKTNYQDENKLMKKTLFITAN